MTYHAPLNYLIIDQSGTPIVAPLDALLNTVKRVVVPGGLLALNDLLEVYYTIEMTNNANNKTIIVQIGGVTYQSFTINALATANSRIGMMNANSRVAQISISMPNVSAWFGNSSPQATSAIDTRQPFNIDFQIQKANAADNCQLTNYIVQLKRQ